MARGRCFLGNMGPVMFGSQLVANATVEIDNVISLLKIPSGARVLDLCCGIGRHSLELARRGFLVTGVDRTRSYLDEAKKQADMELLGIELIEEDMRLFSRMNTFDAVINMFTAFGYFEDAEDDRRVVANIYKSLKAGGTCIIDTHGKETLARIFQERGWSEKDGVMVLEERKVSPIWSWMWNRWIMLKGNERVEGEFSHRLYAVTEMAALLTVGGFSQVDIYGSLVGTPYDQTAKRLITLGHK